LARAKAAEKSSRAAKAGSATRPAKQIVSSARDIGSRIDALREPSARYPLRSLSNVRYSARNGHLEMPGSRKERPERFLS